MREGTVDRRISVLIIDDEEHFALNLSRLLGNRGFHTSVANSGPEAVDSLNKKRFDAAILDIKMPGMDGIETLKELKRRCSDIQVIMLTGHADVESGIEAIREGAFDYLFKPCDIDVLIEKIREAVEAAEIKRRPVLWPRSVVKEISNPDFIRLESGDELKKALHIFNSMGRAGMREELHVTDTQDRLRGVISKNDLVQEAQRVNSGRLIEWEDLAGHPEWLPQKQIAEVMRQPPGTYSKPDEKLDCVAERMIRDHLRCLPVIDDGRFIGIIRLKDVLHYVSLGDGDSGDRHGGPE